MKRLILITVIAALAPVAMAADNTPAAATPAAAQAPVADAPTAPAEIIAPASCEKPQIQYDKKGLLTKGKELQAKITVYKSCIDAYVAAQKQAAQAHYDAGNVALHDFNAFADEVNTASEKLKDALAKQTDKE